MPKHILVAAAAVFASALAPATGAATGVTACPQLMPLAANSISPSVAAALRTFKAGDKPLVTGAQIASADTARGRQAKAECGSTVWNRTVVVYVTQRSLLPSASLSQRVFFVGHAKAGYRVWQTVR